jgi:hypothetical protein
MGTTGSSTCLTLPTKTISTLLTLLTLALQSPCSLLVLTTGNLCIMVIRQGMKITLHFKQKTNTTSASLTTLVSIGTVTFIVTEGQVKQHATLGNMGTTLTGGVN